MTLAARFDLGRPLPLHFLRRASKAGGVDSATHTLAKYIVELSLGVYSLCHIPPSKLSAAALALAMRLLEPGATLASQDSGAKAHLTLADGATLSLRHLDASGHGWSGKQLQRHGDAVAYCGRTEQDVLCIDERQVRRRPTKTSWSGYAPVDLRKRPKTSAGRAL